MYGIRKKVEAKDWLKDKYQYFISVLIYMWFIIFVYDVYMWSMILVYDDYMWYMILIYDFDLRRLCFELTSCDMFIHDDLVKDVSLTCCDRKRT